MGGGLFNTIQTTCWNHTRPQQPTAGSVEISLINDSSCGPVWALFGSPDDTSYVGMVWACCRLNGSTLDDTRFPVTFLVTYKIDTTRLCELFQAAASLGFFEHSPAVTPSHTSQTNNPPFGPARAWARRNLPVHYSNSASSRQRSRFMLHVRG